MTTHQKNAFTILQQRWIRHQELRTNQAPIPTLAASRQALDAARLMAHRAGI